MKSILIYFFLVYPGTSRAQEDCKGQTVNLTGGGSSLAASLYTELGAIYSAKRNEEGQKVIFSYKSRNSGYGLGRITMTIPDEPPIVFGAADKTMSEEQSALHKNLITFPTLAGALLVIYNLPEGGNTTLIITGKILAEIYRGKITHWDNMRIKELNKEISLTHNRIHLVARSDNSGESFIVTGGLAQFDPVWNSMYGTFSDPNFADGICCNSTNWPQDVIHYFANGVRSMIGIVSSIPYTIGYASAANVFESGDVKYAYFMNKARRINKADQKSVQAAVDFYLRQPRINPFVFNLNNALSPDAYPLASFSYMVVNASTHEEISCCQMQELTGFVEFILEAESSLFIKHHLVSLSSSMVSFVMLDAIQTIQCKGKLAYKTYRESVQPKFKVEIWHGLIIGLSGLLFILLTVAVIYGLNVRKAKKIALTKWLLTGRVTFKIGRSDHSLEMDQAASSETQKRSRVTFKSEVMEMDEASSSQSREYHLKKFYYHHGEFEGSYVMLDKLNIKHDPKDWHKRTQTLIYNWREDIIHKNVIKLMGVAVIDGINYTVMEDASKGTLHYVLKTCRYDVNETIKYALCLNSSEGLAFLHRKGIVHGQLNSINCYLDGGWMIKIGGWYRFAMINQEDPQQLEKELVAPNMSEKLTDLIKLMYMEPNFIKQKEPCGDIFSLGLLCMEIFTKKLPFKDCTERFIQDKFYKSADVMKSQLNLDEVPENVRPLIGSCIGPKYDRPNANCVSEIIKELKPTSNSIIDAMMDSVQKYTSDLETQADVQAGELTTMGNRVTDVLNRVLPNGLASKFLKDEPHAPEHFECVSICSFGLVGFNKVKNQNGPLERVMVMNELSNLIDSMIEKSKVTKVYTIGGSSYMACSGLSKSDKTTHVEQIASFSTALLEAMLDFKMEHMTTESPSIQCGIECGPVTVGVVGTVIPLYCVVGATIGMASLMERTSEPLKILVSENAYKQFQKHSPKRKFELRGKTAIKGQLKPVKTYWIVTDPSTPVLPKI